MYMTEVQASTYPETEQGRSSGFGELYISETLRAKNLKYKREYVHVHKFEVNNFSKKSSES